MPERLSRPPTVFETRSSALFQATTLAMAALVAILVLAITARIAWTAMPAIRAHGLGFLVGTRWDVTRAEFGIWPQIAGTLYSSALALMVATVFGLATAIVLTQDFLPRGMEQFLAMVVQTLASIPSVVYGLWGLFVILPLLKGPADWLHEHFAAVPLFAGRLNGPGVLPTVVVLAIMLLPTIVALSRVALDAVPVRLKDAGFGLGATRWEVILRVVIPTATPGILGSIVLAFGRAIGETMAVAMLIGNSEIFRWSLFSPGTTFSALLANHFAEANANEVSALMYASLVLLAMTLVLNLLGERIVRRAIGENREAR